MVNFATENFLPFRFSTEELAPRERIPFFREVLGRSLVKVDIEPLSDEPFRSEATVRALPGLTIVSHVGTSNRTLLTRELIAAEGTDDLVLITAGGSAFASQRGRQAAIANGDAVLMSKAEPGLVVFPSTASSVSIKIPRTAVTPMVSNLEAALVSPISRDNEAMRLLTPYLDLLTRDATLLTPDLCRLAVAHVHDLVALAIGATRDAAEIAKGRGLRAARLHAIKADIVRNIREGDVSVTAIAARHHVSPRYIRKVFESEETTFSQFVLALRLARVHGMLTDPRYCDLTIAAIAFGAGFGDLSTFNRAFRRRYGLTPSELRPSAASLRR